MSILIKGMEMPKNCDMCIYSAWSNYFQIYVCDAARESEPVLFGGKQVNIIDIVRSGRADNCPLIEIPTHGRLIDADALIKTCGMATDCYDCPNGEHGWCKRSQDAANICEAIDDAPTIIPAEESKDG